MTSGASSVAVSSQNANFSYPVGSDVEDETTGTTGGATYGASQVGDYYPLGAPQVYIGTDSASAHSAGPVSSNVNLWASTYNCTGTSTTTNGNISPCTLEIGGKNPNYARQRRQRRDRRNQWDLYRAVEPGPGRVQRLRRR